MQPGFALRVQTAYKFHGAVCNLATQVKFIVTAATAFLYSVSSTERESLCNLPFNMHFTL